MKKINVIGTSGSGKSTFARALAKQLNYPYIEMDAIFWGENWYWPTDEEFFANLEKQLDIDEWVLDGNYTRSIPVKWQQVDTLIWIDYSFHRTLYQALARALNRAFTGSELWPNTGNRETFRKLFSKDSIVLWTLKTYRKNKRKYQALMHDPGYQHLTIERIRSPKQARQYINNLASL